MDKLVRILASLSDFLWDFFICFLAVATFYFVMKFVELGANPIKFFKNRRYYYLVFVHKKAVELLSEGKSNAEIRDYLRAFRFPFQSGSPMTPNIIDDISFVGRVLNNNDLLDIYIIKYSFEYDDFKRLSASMDAEAVETAAKAKISALLNDDSPKNVNRVVAALIAWHTEPFIPEKTEEEKISVGENEAYFYSILDSEGITKPEIPLQKYVDAMLALKSWHPEISVVRSKSSLSDHASKSTAHNIGYSAISQEVSRFSETLK